MCVCVFLAPDWATDCLIRALPSLTIQYIADSATIELSRDCGSEGIKRLTCNGKQDQDLIQRELMCVSERETITSDNEMKAVAAVAAAAATADEQPLPPDTIDDAAQSSDNMENNNIDKIANQIEASVDKLNDKYNLDEAMMGDAPVASQEDADDVKPMKNMKKIASEKPLKNQPKQMRKMKMENKDDFMMGDQPAVEILSHAEQNMDEHLKKPVEIVTTPSSLAEILKTTIEVRNRRETEMPVKMSTSAPATTETSIQNELNTIHLKASHKEITHDHFIPPMLLVQHQNSTHAPAIEIQSTTAFPSNSTSESNQLENQASSTQQVPTTNPSDLITVSSTIETSSTILMTVTPIANATQEATTVSTKTPTTATPDPVPTSHEQVKTNMMRPHAPKFGGEISYRAPILPITTKTPVEDVQINETIPVSPLAPNATETATIAENVTSSGDLLSSSVKPTEQQATDTINGTAAMTTTEQSATATESPTTAYSAFVEVAKRSNYAVDVDKHQHKQHQSKVDSHNHTDAATKHADFTNSDVDYKQFKPNRKRILTKPETHNYIQKIFG